MSGMRYCDICGRSELELSKLNPKGSDARLIDLDYASICQECHEIIKSDPIGITSIMELIKTCIVLLEANMSNSLTVKIVQEAKRLCSLQVPADNFEDTIPF